MKEFLFYTYDSTGKDMILTVRADDRAAAFKEFDRLHGEDTLVDFCIERGQEYVEAISDAFKRGGNV